MMVYPISFYGYKINKEDIKIMEKMGAYLKKVSGKYVHVHPIDVLVYDEPVKLHDNGVVFGPNVAKFAEGKCKYQLPDIKKLYKDGEPSTRQKAMTILYSLAQEIKNYKEEPEEKQEVYVEKENVKFGSLQDIEITEKEAEHLKKIKDILGGGKMTIKKGDITIEVE